MSAKPLGTRSLMRPAAVELGGTCRDGVCKNEIRLMAKPECGGQGIHGPDALAKEASQTNMELLELLAICSVCAASLGGKIHHSAVANGNGSVGQGRWR